LRRAPVLDAGHPHRPVADVRPAPLSVGHRAGRPPRAPARDRGLWQSDRHGAHARAGAEPDLRHAGSRRRAGARGGTHPRGAGRAPRRPPPPAAAPLPPPGARPAPPAAADAGLRLLSQRAWEAWQKSQEALRRGDWTVYGQEQKRLEEALRQLREGRQVRGRRKTAVPTPANTILAVQAARNGGRSSALAKESAM